MSAQGSNNQSKIKTFVLDTNVLIHKPDAFLSFKDNEVVIPLFVLEELDNLKSSPHEKGYNARQAIKALDAMIPTSGLNKGVKIENNITLWFEADMANLPKALISDRTDNKILGTALKLQEEGKEVFFVSKDINARVKASALGIKVVDYEKDKVNATKLYQGYKDQTITAEKLSELQEKGSLSIEEKLYPNQYINFTTKEGHSSIARYDEGLSRLLYIEPVTRPICGIKPLNNPQSMAIDLLLDPSIELVSLIGKAGTGKTLLAIACGLKQVLEDKNYSRVMVSRPVIPMGKDIGYLPGDKKEKLSNWMRPIFDNLEFLLANAKLQDYKNAEGLISQNKIEVEALTYIRGRSLPGQFIIIDEAQNLTPHEIKTVVSRAGANSKIVLTGDPHQIDNTYLDANSNGLSYLIEAFKGQSIFGHITLEKTERSRLAKLAAELL